MLTAVLASSHQPPNYLLPIVVSMFHYFKAGGDTLSSSCTHSQTRPDRLVVTKSYCLTYAARPVLPIIQNLTTTTLLLRDRVCT